MAVDELLDSARTAVSNAYVPYSEYGVGAAIETADGTIITGCNIEVANYSNTLHAEEVALGTAIQNGHTEFQQIAVSSAAQDGVTPCGMCRQSLAEFGDASLPIICDDDGTPVTYTLGELLPEPIASEHL